MTQFITFADAVVELYTAGKLAWSDEKSIVAFARNERLHSEWLERSNGTILGSRDGKYYRESEAAKADALDMWRRSLVTGLDKGESVRRALETLDALADKLDSLIAAETDDLRANKLRELQALCRYMPER